MPEPSATSLPFTDAIDFFRSKLGNLLPSKEWTDTYGRVNAHGFAVAGAWKEALLADLGAAVLKAMEAGSTPAEFQKDFEAIAAKHQWAYRGESAWRAAIVLNTNLRSAFAAGKWQHAQQSKATRPYLMYEAVLDSRTRPLHRQWDGTILPVDHPWWKTHYPPNGWNCRCTVISLAERDLKRRGLSVSEDPPVGLIPQQVDPRRGVGIKAVPAGIDPGFEHNPGAVLETPLIPQLVTDQEQGFAAPIAPTGRDAFTPPASDLPSLPPPRRVSADRLLPRSTTPQAAVDALMQELGATEERPAAIDDHAGAKLMIGPQMFTRPGEGVTLGPAVATRHVPLLAELLREPDEVWVALDAGLPGGPGIRRRMLARMTIEGTGEQVLVVIEIVRGRAAIARVLPLPPDGGQGPASAYLDARATYGLRLFARTTGG